MKVSVCVDALFNGQEMIPALGRLKACGIDTIEFWGWADKDLDGLEAALSQLEMKVATFCTKATSLVDPSQHESYLLGLSESLVVAKRFQVDRLIGLVGNDTGAPRQDQHRHLVEGLKKCLPMLEAAGVTLMIEPLNTLIDHQGYFLSRSDEAFQLVKEVKSPFVKVLFDVYHQQISEGNLLNNMTANMSMIGHIHTAGHPGRHELYKGEINYTEVIKAVQESPYQGYLGLEYFPLDQPEIGLKKTLELVGADHQSMC